MEKDVDRLVQAVWEDLRQTYGEGLTLEYMRQEAERQLRGEKPRGGPGVFLQDYLRKAGFLK